MERDRVVHSALVLVFVIASNARAQQFAAAQPEGNEPVEASHAVWREHIEPAQPAGREHGAILAIPRVLAGELASTGRDFVMFRDAQWELLTLAQIGAASADAKTSLYNLGHCASCRETGLSSFVVGSRPDAHKYIVAGIIEITVEAVAGHYLRNHGPVRKWYWRYIWSLPQTISLYEHAYASMHNAGINLSCNSIGQHC